MLVEGGKAGKPYLRWDNETGRAKQGRNLLTMIHVCFVSADNDDDDDDDGGSSYAREGAGA